MFLLFTLIMFALALSAHFRSVQVRWIRGVWFFISLLPSELPWVFGFIQVIAILVFSVSLGELNAANIIAIALSLMTLGLWYRLHRRAFTADADLHNALREGLGDDYESEPISNSVVSAPSVIEEKAWLRPFSFRRTGIERLADISYGPHSRQRLDIYRPAEAADNSAENIKLRPILLQVHGGGWMVGHKRQQAKPLIHYLAQNGWICVDINYRLSPRHRYPACLTDVKMAIAWLKDNIASYGGDPLFIAITGGSAGGHLSILSALTANTPQFQPGFEQADTRVQAVVSMYGVYDFTNSNRSWSGAALQKFLYRFVMPSSFEADPELWQAASPKFHISEKAPPMFVIHGTNDCLVFIEDVRDFIRTARAKVGSPILYAELVGAQHGFDLFHSVRVEYTLEAVGKFLQFCYTSALSERKAGDQKAG